VCVDGREYVLYMLFVMEEKRRSSSDANMDCVVTLLRTIDLFLWVFLSFLLEVRYARLFRCTTTTTMLNIHWDTTKILRVRIIMLYFVTGLFITTTSTTTTRTIAGGGKIMGQSRVSVVCKTEINLFLCL
jgi:hypothetical protein